MTNPKQKKFLNHIKELGRIMTDDEAVEYYVENHMRNDVTCKFNPYAKYFDRQDGVKKQKHQYYDDYSFEEIVAKGRSWHKLMIGQLVIRGYLPISLEEVSAAQGGQP